MDIIYYLLIAAIISFLLIYTNFDIIGWVYSYITWFKDIMHLRTLPSPPGHWLFGHALKLGNINNILTYTQEVHRKCSDKHKFYVYWIGPFIPFVFTGNVEIVKIFLQQSGEKPKPSIMYKNLKKWNGDGLINSSGAKWRQHRKLLTSAFYFDILKHYVPVYNELTDKLLEIWSSYADTGESVDITPYAKALSMEVLLKCLYSHSGGYLENKESMHLQAVERLSALVAERLFIPYYFFDWIYFNTASGREFLYYCDLIHKYSDKVIMKRRKELQQGTENSRKYKDFVHILLSIKDENGKGLTDSEIRDEVHTFISAGHTPIATTISWCLYCLAKDQKHQEMCRKEIKGILSERDSNEITWEDLSKLNYITMCIKETLRLYSIAPFVGKLLSEDTMVDGYRIPKGTFVGIGIDAMHHDPSIWDDPEKFDPLRFTDEKCKNRDAFTFLAFSAGPRNCIGQRFALHQLKVTIANILNRFKVEFDTSHEVQPQFDVVFMPKNGIKLKFYTVE